MVLCLLLWLVWIVFVDVFFFFKQKTAYEMRISDWSSDVCSSDLPGAARPIDGNIGLWRRHRRGRGDVGARPVSGRHPESAAHFRDLAAGLCRRYRRAAIALWQDGQRAGG